MSKSLYSATGSAHRRNKSAITIQAWPTNSKTLNPAGQVNKLDARQVEFRDILAEGFHFRPSDTLPHAETRPPRSRPDVADLMMENIQAARARTVEILNDRSNSCFVEPGKWYGGFRTSKGLHSHPIQDELILASAVGGVTGRATSKTCNATIPKQGVFAQSRFSTDSEGSEVECIATQRVGVKGLVNGKVVSRVLIG